MCSILCWFIEIEGISVRDSLSLYKIASSQSMFSNFAISRSIFVVALEYIRCLLILSLFIPRKPPTINHQLIHVFSVQFPPQISQYDKHCWPDVPADERTGRGHRVHKRELLARTDARTGRNNAIQHSKWYKSDGKRIDRIKFKKNKKSIENGISLAEYLSLI